ncbi:MAG: GNAT family N-acetyltransferase [Clostridia bacterium]|nr:GNAT family N-acetyltransferase [Clostridia bacterium]
MLTIEPTNDKILLDELSRSIFGKALDGSVGFVLFCDETPVGMAHIMANDEVCYLRDIGIVPEERGKGYGDFLTRALLHNLSSVCRRIVVEPPCNYYLQFGFQLQNGKMTADGKDLTFPHKCGHNCQ